MSGRLRMRTAIGDKVSQRAIFLLRLFVQSQLTYRQPIDRVRTRDENGCTNIAFVLSRLHARTLRSHSRDRAKLECDLTGFVVLVGAVYRGIRWLPQRCIESAQWQAALGYIPRAWPGDSENFH